MFLSWLILLARTAEKPIFRYHGNRTVLLAQSMLTLKTSKLTLADVQRHLNFQEKLEDVSFTELLTLETVSDAEKLELVQIRNDFRPYLMEDKASEGQVKVLTLFPLLRLAGFYRYPIKIRVEEGIDNIILVDEDKTISGWFDIVTVNNSIATVNDIPFWILVIEAKESGIEVRQGLPQLLTYAYNSLERQPSVWGLATNGLQYMFVYLRQETNPTYQIMPELNLMYPESAINLLQILKAMGQLILET